MKPAAFAYHSPRSCQEALFLLADKPNAKVLAGGQSLMPMMNFRIAQPDHLIDINRVPELSGLRAEGSNFFIGAMTRQTDLLNSQKLRAALPIFAEALEHVGHVQTRNRGTLGGSLCHADPAAELPTLCALLDASLTVERDGASRSVPMKEWALGYLVTALAPEELLTRVSFKAWTPGHGWAFVEFARRHGDFAIASVGVLLDSSRDGRISRAAISVGGCGGGPVRLDAAEQMLAGHAGDEGLFREAASFADSIDAGSDAYVSADYRRHLVKVLVRRALAQAYARIQFGTA